MENADNSPVPESHLSSKHERSHKDTAHHWDILYKAFLLSLLGLAGAPLVLAPWHAVTPPPAVAAMQTLSSEVDDEHSPLLLDGIIRNRQIGLNDPEYQAKQASFLKALEILNEQESRDYGEVSEVVVAAYGELERKRGRKEADLSEELKALREWLRLR